MKPKKAAMNAGDDDGEDKGDLEFGHQEGRPVGADGKKTGMAEGYLAGGADEDVQTHGQYDVDHDDVEQIDVVARGEQGDGDERSISATDQKRTTPLSKSLTSS